VPDDVSVTGFDGIHPAEWTDPPLTTVAQPIGEMSRWAVFQLRDAVDRGGRLERAAPPRFAQTLGAIFLALATVGLYAAAEETMVWWILGWGPALAVAVLAGLAATTSF
jgi:hypothetical protein